MKKIGIIGYGNMGSAIAERIKSRYAVSVFDKDIAKTAGLEGVSVARSFSDVVAQSEIIILAVKPQDFDGVLQAIKNSVAVKLVVSIAAGITTTYIEKTLGKTRVVRAMPNLGARIGKSVTCISRGLYVQDGDIAEIKDLFSFIGEVKDIDEKMMNAATAISGSGPGYYFHAVALLPDEYRLQEKKFHEGFIADLTEAAQAVGFDKETAEFLARWTIVYSDLLLKQTKVPAGQLREQVASKGGTTEAALTVLERGGSLVEAVKAAVERAKQLSRG